MHKKSFQIGKTLGPYSPALEVNLGQQSMLFISGQIAVDPMSGELVSMEFEDQIKEVFTNLQNILDEANYDFKDIVKVTIFLTNLDYFSKINDEYKLFFEKPYPARSTIQVAALPKGALVEIEAVAVKTVSTV